MARWTRRELNDGAAFCLEIGSGLLENGGETSRVEETIRLAGESMGFTVDAMVMPTAVMVTFGNGEVVTRIARIHHRVINLDKVAKLNSLSRELHETGIKLGALRDRVREIRSAPSTYTTAHQMLATVVASGSFTVLLGGGASEVGLSIAAGVLGRFFLDLVGSEFPSFLSLFSVAFLSTVFGVVGHSQLGLSIEQVVVGSLMPRMPGLAIVSAVRDLMSGELIAGLARAAEAALATLGMASGVLACLAFSYRLGLTGV